MDRSVANLEEMRPENIAMKVRHLCLATTLTCRAYRHGQSHPLSKLRTANCRRQSNDELGASPADGKLHWDPCRTRAEAAKLPGHCQIPFRPQAHCRHERTPLRAERPTGLPSFPGTP